eukprot:403371202
MALLMLIALNLSSINTLRTTVAAQDGDRTWPLQLPGTTVNNWNALSSFFADQVREDGSGKNVFVLFYYSWCHTCMAEYPVFRDSWKEMLASFPNDVAFLKVDMDDKGDLFKYFKVSKSPTFAFLGTGGAGQTIFFQKYSGKLEESKLVTFIKGKMGI